MSKQLDVLLINPCSRPQVYQSLFDGSRDAIGIASCDPAQLG